MTAVVEYVVNSLAWSLVGFALGWVVASLRHDLTQIKETVVHEDPPPTPRHVTHHPSASRWLGIVVALLAAVTVVQGLIAQQKIADVTACQAEFNRDFAHASSLRSQLAAEDRAALNSMLIALYRQRNQPDSARLDTFREWVKTTQANEVERANHPLPDYPIGDCK